MTQLLFGIIPANLQLFHRKERRSSMTRLFYFSSDNTEPLILNCSDKCDPNIYKRYGWERLVIGTMYISHPHMEYVTKEELL